MPSLDNSSFDTRGLPAQFTGRMPDGRPRTGQSGGEFYFRIAREEIPGGLLGFSGQETLWRIRGTASALDVRVEEDVDDLILSIQMKGDPAFWKTQLLAAAQQACRLIFPGNELRPRPEMSREEFKRGLQEFFEPEGEVERGRSRLEHHENKVVIRFETGLQKGGEEERLLAVQADRLGIDFSLNIGFRSSYVSLTAHLSKEQDESEACRTLLLFLTENKRNLD